jgi:6-phospho-beta-glucosidase
MSALDEWRPLSLRWRRLSDGPIRMAVIGGSTPFASRLFEAMRGVSELSWDLRIVGRDEVALELVTAHACAVLGDAHRVVATTDAGRALDGCDVVIVQPRVGGLTERAVDEDLGESVGAPADEGLGPGGARAIIRSAPALRGLSAELRARCSGAFVIAFSNPLSATVSVLHAAGTPSAGVCELPLVTAYEIAGALGVERRRLSWSFTGLSHRGFVHDIAVDGQPRLDELIAALRSTGASIGGIGPDVIAELDAVPLKYHAMVSGTSRPPSGRARALLAIRDDALAELARDPATAPPVLAQRSMPWYHEAVLPVVGAIAGRPLRDRPSHVLDLMCDDGLTHEVVADVGQDRIAVRATDAPAGDTARDWLDVFYEHERLTTDFLAAPTLDGLTAMLTADPATPDSAVERVAKALAGDVARLADSPVAQCWLRA